MEPRNGAAVADGLQSSFSNSSRGNSPLFTNSDNVFAYACVFFLLFNESIVGDWENCDSCCLGPFVFSMTYALC